MTSHQHTTCPICTRPDVPMWWRIFTTLPIAIIFTLPLLFLALWLAPTMLALAIWTGTVVIKWGHSLNYLATHDARHNSSIPPLDDRW